MASTDATIVATTAEAIDAALIPLIMQLHPDRSGENHTFAPFIEGPPGIGKTEVTNQLAKRFGAKTYIVISCGVIDTNLEFIGLPEILREAKKSAEAAGGSAIAVAKRVDVEAGTSEIIDAGSTDRILTKWVKPERLAQFDNLGPNERGLLVFDDTHFLLERQQAMLMQLLTNNRTIHTHKVGDGTNVAIMFLANRLDDNAGAQEMLAPVIDRIKRIVINLDPKKQIEPWADWAEEKGVHGAVISFLRNNPEQLYTFVAESAAGGAESGKFASPRGWKALADELTLLEAFAKGSKDMNDILFSALPDADPDIKDQVVNASRHYLQRNLSKYAAGTVGDTAAREFSAYYTVFSKYDLDKFIGTQNFSSIAKEELPTASYRFAVSLAKRCIDLDVKLQEALLNYVVQNRNKLERLKSSPDIKQKLEKLGSNPDALNSMEPKARQELMDVALILSTIDNKLVEPPAIMLGRVTDKIDEMKKAGKLDDIDLSKMFKAELAGGLKTLGFAGLEEDYLRTFSFMEKFLNHLYTVEPEKRNQMCSNFFGAFAAEMKRSEKKMLTSTLRQSFSTTQTALEVFLRVLLHKQPQLVEFINSRVKISDLVQERETMKKKKTR